MRANQELPRPGEPLTAEDLKGPHRAYYAKLLEVFKGKGMSYEERHRVALQKVVEQIDRQAKRTANEKRQLKLF